MAAGYTSEEIRAQLVKLAAYVPAGETLELCVFGGSSVLHWGMQDRLSNDVDVLQSLSSPGLLDSGGGRRSCSISECRGC